MTWWDAEKTKARTLPLTTLLQCALFLMVVIQTWKELGL